MQGKSAALTHLLLGSIRSTPVHSKSYILSLKTLAAVAEPHTFITKTKHALCLFLTKDLTWTCLQQMCPPLNCPPNEQFTPEDSCCPVCKGERLDLPSVFRQTVPVIETGCVKMTGFSSLQNVSSRVRTDE